MLAKPENRAASDLDRSQRSVDSLRFARGPGQDAESRRRFRRANWDRYRPPARVAHNEYSALWPRVLPAPRSSSECDCARSSCLRLPRRLRLGQIVQVISVAADSDIPTGELYDALGNIQTLLVVARRIVRRLSFLKRL